MSTDLAAASQPYSCHVCQSRFTRHENLKRHAAIHEHARTSNALSCGICDTTFSRSDLRHRHMRRKHPGVDLRATHQTKKARHDSAWSREDLAIYQDGRSPSTGIESSSPEDSSHGWRSQRARDFESGQEIQEDTWALSTAERWSQFGPTHRTTGTEPRQVDSNEPWHMQERSIPELMDVSVPMLSASAPATTARDGYMDDALRNASNMETRSWQPSNSQKSRGVELFFAHLSDSLPCIHRPTFNVGSVPEHLLLALMSLGYQHENEGNTTNRGSLSEDLSLACYSKSLLLLDLIDDDDLRSVTETLEVIQSLLLLDICAILYLCGKHSGTGLRLHSRMVSLARSSALLHSIPQATAASQDLDAVWHDFARAESCKRTMLAMHQIDALWYHFLSIPRLLSHLEIKHDLPCHTQDWLAPSSAQWAYRQLMFQASASLPTYTDSIRHFLSETVVLDANEPTFDPYGLTNFAHFVLSSLREISGWSTITGRVSMDRVEPLKASLHAVEGYIIATQDDSNLCVRATWETAMIELHVWSLSHTGGVVHSSVDKALTHATELAIARDLNFNAEIFESIRSHLEWFLRYLDRTHAPDCEPPWLTLFSYKVFLIVWQCLQQGMPGAMGVVSVPDGDTMAAVKWAQAVFARRESRQCGRMIMICLEKMSQAS